VSGGVPLVGVLNLVRFGAIAVAGRLTLLPVSPGFALARRHTDDRQDQWATLSDRRCARLAG